VLVAGWAGVLPGIPPEALHSSTEAAPPGAPPGGTPEELRLSELQLQ